MKNKIIVKLLEMGVKSSYRGFPIVVRCLEIALSLDYVLITKDVYPVVASEMKLSPTIVESRFRRTLQKSGLNFTNLEFVSYFVTIFRMECEECS